jgi:hypothetical protein
VSRDPKSYREEVLNTLKIFSDEPDDQSKFFNFEIYANQLCDLIRNDIPGTSFAICLNGEWGSGKTSLLKRVCNRLDNETNDRFKVLWFDAWQYERLDPVLALLQKIAILYENKSDKLKDIMKSLTLVFSDIVLRKTTDLTVQEIQKHFETSVKEVETMAETLQNIIGEDGRLVVFIDDLDRCSIESTLDILESIKLLFNARNVTFVVAADMKKLEMAWTLRYKRTIDSLDGREHLDKIFQLKLSLPPKISFPKEGSEKEANKLIEQYLNQYLKIQLPSDLQEFIINGFPPNPRKIKRALSLAYFIGKNIILDGSDAFPEGFISAFPLVLIWGIITSYFFDLADLLRKSPYFLIHICMLVADTLDIGNLQLKIHTVRSENEPVVAGKRESFDRGILGQIEPAALIFVEKYVVNDPTSYRFLKSIANLYKMDPHKFTQIDEIYHGLIYGLKIVIDSVGLIY